MFRIRESRYSLRGIDLLQKPITWQRVILREGVYQLKELVYGTVFLFNLRALEILMHLRKDIS